MHGRSARCWPCVMAPILWPKQLGLINHKSQTFKTAACKIARALEPEEERLPSRSSLSSAGQAPERHPGGTANPAPHVLLQNLIAQTASSAASWDDI